MADHKEEPVLVSVMDKTSGRPDLAIMACTKSGAGIPLIDLMELNGPERRKVVEAIGRACESDDGFFIMVTNHGGVPAPAGVVEGMLRVDGDLFHFHLPESSERLKCYSDDPIKAAEARALLESLGLELERSHMVAVMGRDAQPHMAVNSYPPCPQPDLIITYGLPVHKDPHAIITQLLQDQQDGVSGIQVQRGSRWVAVNPVAADALVISIGDQMQAIGLSTSFNVPSSFRFACSVLRENIHRVIQQCMHKLGCSSPSYFLPITVNDPSPHGSETESPFSPLFILEKNDVKVEVITNETTADEDVSKFDLATIAGTLSLVVPMAINIDELTKTWGPLWKVLCGIFMIMSLVLVFIGLFTASFRCGSRARNLSSHCARMSLVLATIMFMLLIASKLGCFGCAAGVVLVLVMLVLTILWIRSEHEI